MSAWCSIEALFGIKFIDKDAPSYSNCTPESVLEPGAQEKRSNIRKAVEDLYIFGHISAWTSTS